MKVFIKKIHIIGLSLCAICNVAIADIVNTQSTSNITNPINKLNASTNCDNNKGYLVSISTSYKNNKDWLTFTIQDDKGNYNWYWGAFLTNTAAGKSMLTTAIYAASSGQTVSILCDSNNYIKSLWVDPNAL
ncbi:hypothetical protein [Xenorhabdus koppenhoeferi]|uniref:Uncharacterized protein n=1 Tax=Xenorhabdus koppenhoeferi TaxID=351659 RepID=A0A1I7KH51_9GAMM|nr:hypothetical protein [Xenorhabdus koppenhoeferi]SFU96674.1 hypothetical protein SAMN05421784_1624 [Xenorhabdus koppenhoeferi]